MTLGHDGAERLCAWTNPRSTKWRKTFMRARQTGERLDALPAHLTPKNFADSCAVMDAVDRLVGERIVGTKIAAKPGAEVVYAPLQASRIFTARRASRAR